MQNSKTIINDSMINERLIKQSMINDIDAVKVDSIADWLVDKLASPQSRQFFCLVAWKIPQATIDRLATQAIEKGRNPGALFNHLARKEMR